MMTSCRRGRRSDDARTFEIRHEESLDRALEMVGQIFAEIEVDKMYQGKVEPRRFALTEIQQHLDNPEAAALLAAPGSEGLFQELEIDDLLGVLSPGDGNTSFEELECVGLNPNRDTLVGIIRVKKPAGYSGGPCTTGSKEYVTFWADFNNNGTFETCLGTAAVNVYDFNDIPDEGLEYGTRSGMVGTAGGAPDLTLAFWRTASARIVSLR